MTNQTFFRKGIKLLFSLLLATNGYANFTDYSLPLKTTTAFSNSIDTIGVYAGPDTMICGFTYQLEGNLDSGTWRNLCSESAGLVAFGNAEEDTTTVQVDQCGAYIFVYDVNTDSCIGTDTVIVMFENPSSSLRFYTLNTEIELQVNCPEPDTVCGNEIAIPSITLPELLWNFCGEIQCNSTVYSAQAGTAIDSCLVQDISYSSMNYADNGDGCVTATSVTADNILTIIDELYATMNVGCPTSSKCFQPPPECIDTLQDTTYFYIPILSGGLWHYIDSNGVQQPLMDTTPIYIDTIEYVFVLSPGADYYGPEDIVVSVYELDDSNALVPPYMNVELDIQWVNGYGYDTLTIIEEILVVNDSCYPFSCSGFQLIKPVLDIPLPPPYPCVTTNLSFRLPPNQQHELALFPCIGGSATFEVCTGQVEEFTADGTYVYECFASNGCPYEVTIEVASLMGVPMVTNTNYWCDIDDELYSVSFMLENDQGDSSSVEIVGMGTYNYYELIAIENIPSCQSLSLDFVDQNSFCENSFSFFYCCNCLPSTTELIGTICEGDSYSFNGQLLSIAGIYDTLLTNYLGCDSLVTLNLLVNPLVTSQQSVSICEGESYDFYGTMLLATGIYDHPISATVGCDTLIILDLTVDSVSMVQLNDTICEGTIYDFYGAPLTVSGVYTHNIIGTIGCDTLIVLNLVVIPIPGDESYVSICEGETYDFYGTALNSSGIYSMLISNGGTCDSILTLNLTVNPTYYEAITASICDGDSYDFNGTAFSSSGTYDFNLSTISGCDSIVELTITVLTHTSVLIEPVICKGEFLSLSSGQVMEETGLYFDTLIAANGCDSIVEINLTVEQLEVEVEMESDCWNSDGGTLDVVAVNGGSAPYFYSVDNISFQENSVFESLVGDSYTVYVTDLNNCRVEKVVDLPQVDPIIIDLETDYYFCVFEEVELNVESLYDNNYGQLNFNWEDGSTEARRSIGQPGIYSLNVYNECEEQSHELELQYDQFKLEDRIYVPNAFSPNRDQVNDYFKAYAGIPLTEVEFYVFDIWGNILYRTNDLDDGWDGRKKHTKVNPGVFVWWLKAKAVNCNGETEEVFLKGDVTLIK